MKKDYGIMKFYRVSNHLYKKGFKLIPKLIKIFIRVMYSCTLPYNAEIGYGTKFPHFGQGVVINERCKIGDNCLISAGVIIGGKKNGTPIIGNNVTIGANSTIIGKVSIGDNSTIGAGAVVTHDVHENSVYVGNPAKKIK